MIGPYTILRRVGSGGYGDVFACRVTAEPAEPAVATVAVKRFGPSPRNLELENLRSAGNPFLVAAPNRLVDIRDFTREYLAMEYCVFGDLFSQVRHRPLPCSVARAWIRDTAEGLTYLHRKGWVHGDVKPENILIRGDGTACLCDFGFSVHVESGKMLRLATVEYAAPELVKSESVLRPEANKVDTWSLGVTALIAILRVNTGHRVPDLVRSGSLWTFARSRCPQHPLWLSRRDTREVVSFVDAALRVAPSARPTAEDLLYDPLLRHDVAARVELGTFLGPMPAPPKPRRPPAHIAPAHAPASAPRRPRPTLWRRLLRCMFPCGARPSSP